MPAVWVVAGSPWVDGGGDLISIQDPDQIIDRQLHLEAMMMDDETDDDAMIKLVRDPYWHCINVDRLQVRSI